jgi:hypothetical protein
LCLNSTKQSTTKTPVNAALDFLWWKMTDYLQDLYNKIKLERFGLTKTSIFDLNESDFSKSCDLRFACVGVEFDEILGSDISVDEHQITKGYGVGESIRGKTNFYIATGISRSAIFILDKGDDIASMMYKLISLIHELGHAHDFDNKINFDENGIVSSIVELEIYAEVFALKYLERNKSCPLHKLIRSQYANALLQRKGTSDFYQKVHLGINRYFKDGRIKRWKKI